MTNQTYNQAWNVLHLRKDLNGWIQANQKQMREQKRLLIKWLMNGLMNKQTNRQMNRQMKKNLNNEFMINVIQKEILKQW